MKYLLSPLLLLFAARSILLPQDIASVPAGKWKGFIHLETGYIYPVGSIKETVAIRQNISSYFVNQSSDGEILSETSGFQFGLKYEYFYSRFKTGISAGMRYTGFRTDISGFSASNADFFYLRYSMEGTDTKFARVKSISEVNNFISIPLEIRVVPLRYRNIALFFRAGAEYSRFNLKKGTDIEFQDKAMEVNEAGILENIGASTNKNYASLYGSVGVQCGKENKANYLFEIFLPSYFLTDQNFAMSDVDYFEGFKFSVQIPLKK